jgi:hypothetical protein
MAGDEGDYAEAVREFAVSHQQQLKPKQEELAL